MGGPWEDYADGPWSDYTPSASEDILSVAPGSVGRSLANTLGTVLPLPGAQQLLSNAPEAVSHLLTGKPLYQAKTIPGKIADKTIEFAPTALTGPGSAGMKTAMTVVPAIASTLAGEAAKGTGYEDAAEFAGALAGPLGVQKAANTLATRGARKALLNTGEIKTARDSLYRKSREMGVLIKPEAYQTFATNLAETLQKAKYKLRIASKLSAGTLDTIIDDAQSMRPQSLEELHTISEHIGNLIDDSNSTTRGLGKLMYKKIQEFKRGLTDTDVIAPEGMTPQMAVQMEREGDALHNRYMKSKTLDIIYKKAKNRGANYTVAGEALGIRQKFRQLADKFADPDAPEARWFTKAEQDAIEKVARGGNIQNFIRWMGKFSADHIKGAGASAVGATIGSGMGGPIGAAIGASAPTALSLPFKFAEHLWTKANANKVSDLIRGGGPLSVPQTPYPGLLAPLALPGLIPER